MELARTLEGHSDSVRSVAFSSDDQLLASGSRDNTVKIWDPRNGSCLRTLEGHSNFVRSVAFSSDDQLLASGSGDKTVKIWDTGHEPAVLPGGGAASPGPSSAVEALVAVGVAMATTHLRPS